MNGADDILDAYLRLYEVAVGAERFAPLALVFAGKCGHHNDLDVFCLRGGAQNIKHVEAADFRHHDVADNQRGALFNSHGQRFLAVASRNDVVALGQQPHAVDFAQAFVVFYQ